MTKQEEIREGIAKLCANGMRDCKYECESCRQLNKALKDVMIRVDRELPICFGEFRSPKNKRENDYLVGWNDCKNAMAGCVAVEPLVKEE